MKEERTLLASEEFNLQFKYMMYPYVAIVAYYIIEINKIESELTIYDSRTEKKVYDISIFTDTLNEGIKEVRRTIDKGGFYIK